MISQLEKRMIYFPDKYPVGYWEPELFGVNPEDHWFTADDGVKLHGWYIEGDNAKLDVTILWFHGNAGNITHRLDNMRRLLELGLNIFIFDYRGYGRSEGEPDEQGLYRDGIAAYEYLIETKNLDPNNLVLFGRSLGTAVAVEVARNRQSRGMILETPFTNARDMAKIMLPYIPVGPFLSTQFDSIEKIKHIFVPILFIHGDKDKLIPIELGRKIFEAANEPKKFYTIRGADHNNTYIVGGDEYFQTIKNFLNSI